ncbi:hypothetical protein JWG43_02770 [Desulfobulbus alkaliphilus]|nr:hypothetical protein [Desulfobulbus alkaliphilus]
MAGDSISQARQAVSDILSQLRADDWFNIILFGTTHRQLFDRQVPATSEHITRVRRVLRTIEADMGGTEMEEALVATVATPGPATIGRITPQPANPVYWPVWPLVVD